MNWLATSPCSEQNAAGTHAVSWTRIDGVYVACAWRLKTVQQGGRPMRLPPESIGDAQHADRELAQLRARQMCEDDGRAMDTPQGRSQL